MNFTSNLWLIIDKIITFPFFFIGYISSMVIISFQQGYRKYIKTVIKAERGQL